MWCRQTNGEFSKRKWKSLFFPTITALTLSPASPRFCRVSKPRRSLRPGVYVPANKVDPQPIYRSTLKHQKLFAEGDSLSSGVMQIPTGNSKPTMTSGKESSYVSFTHIEDLRLWQGRLKNEIDSDHLTIPKDVLLHRRLGLGHHSPLSTCR